MRVWSAWWLGVAEREKTMLLPEIVRHTTQSINQSIYLMSWGATGTQQTRHYWMLSLTHVATTIPQSVSEAH